jgi:hypothetical protein
MPFSDQIVERAWKRSGGVCECTREKHADRGVCKQKLNKDQRGDKDSPHGWEAHSISGLYKNIASDCEILCWDCYKLIS